MTIFIVGLGLIGSSYAARFKAKGHRVYGYDKDENTRAKAIELKLIESGELRHLTGADVLIFATYPDAMRAFLEHHHHQLSPHTLLTDVVGVKVPLMTSLLDVIPQPERYLSHHPMAGKAASGIEHVDAGLFEGATCVLIDEPFQENALKGVLRTLLEDLGFARFVSLSAEEHDRAIGYVSQLTHAIAGALMHMEEALLWSHTAGDSFADLTRIAAMNAPMWTQLFEENHPVLADQLTRFASELTQLSQLLQTRNSAQLERYLSEAAHTKAKLEESKK